MCGRFTITLETSELQLSLGLSEMPADWQPRYNLAPSQLVGVVTDAQTRRLEWMRWGLVPAWAKDPAIGNQLINARSETVAEKPSFRTAFARRRCLIPADGFYEWQTLAGTKGGKQPFYFRRMGGKPFAFAGLWERWLSPEKQELLSCTILTCVANDVVAPVHERMPVMLSGDGLWDWLTENSPAALLGMLRPYPVKEMEAYPVSRLVNRSDQDLPECIRPATTG